MWLETLLKMKMLANLMYKDVMTLHTNFLLPGSTCNVANIHLKRNKRAWNSEHLYNRSIESFELLH